MTYFMVKVFSNGGKALLKMHKMAPAVLKIFDKNGCLVAQRETNKTAKVIEKMTLRADQTGKMSKEYRLLGHDFEGDKINCPARKVGLYEMFPSNPNDKGYYLLENERSLYKAQKEGARGDVTSDLVLKKMLGQWFNRGEQRQVPKPIPQQLKLLNSALEYLKEMIN